MIASWLPALTEAGLPTLPERPCASAGTAASASALFDWDTLDRVLASDGPLDLMTVRGGQLVRTPPPRSVADVRRLMQSGVSTVIRGSEAHDAGLADLAAAIGQVLPGEVHVQLYATPGGTNSYGWHYDFEDVFIAQTAGIKDYYFRANTVAGDAVLGDDLDFGVFRNETSPLLAAQLHAGDALYLPSRWWHLVKCAEDSLSISVGVMPPGEFAKARRVPPGWTGPPR